MAGFNEILSGRWNRALQKLLSMKGGPVAPTLAGEWYPTLTEDGYGRDIDVLLSWNHFSNLQSIGAGVGGQFASFALRNPVGSKVIAIIESMYVYQLAGGGRNGEILVGGLITDLSSVQGGGANMDRRVNTDKPTTSLLSTCVTSRQMLAAGAVFTTATWAKIFFTGLSAAGEESNGIDLIPDKWRQIVLAPGTGMCIQCDQNADGTGAAASISWRERVLEDSELSA